jgi:hypothetical protein
MPKFDPQPEREIFGRTPDCPSVDDLAALASMTDAAASQANAHVGQCPYCRNEVALLRTFESSAATPEESAAVAWISAELGRRESPWLARTSPSLWERLTSWIPAPAPRWLPAAAMACLLVIIGSGLYFSNRRPAGVPDDVSQGSAWRSTRVPIVGPAGDVAVPPSELTWRAVEGASLYHVRLLEVDGTEVWSADTAATQIAIPPQVRAQLQPGRSFRWQVAANSAAGRIAESSLQSFHIL